MGSMDSESWLNGQTDLYTRSENEFPVLDLSINSFVKDINNYGGWNQEKDGYPRNYSVLQSLKPLPVEISQDIDAADADEAGDGDEDTNDEFSVIYDEYDVDLDTEVEQGHFVHQVIAATPYINNMDRQGSEVLTVNHKSDMQMSGGSILVRSPSCKTKAIVNLDLVNLYVNPLSSNLESIASEHHVPTLRSEYSNCESQNSGNKRYEHLIGILRSEYNEKDYGSPLCLKLDLPEDLSLQSGKKTDKSQDVSKEKQRNSQYLVDEGIQPLCTMQEDTDVEMEQLRDKQGFTDALDYTSRSIEARDREVSKLQTAKEALGKKSYSCPHCSSVFRKFHLYMRHLDCDCEQIKKNLIVRSTEYNHLIPDLSVLCSTSKPDEKYRDRGLHVCTCCNAAYKARSALVRHVERVHSGATRTAESNCKSSSIPQCPFCGDSFTSIQGYRFHLKVHKTRDLSAYSYTCTLCGGRYLQEDQLERHIRRMHSTVI